jgi:2-polyprenyl-3-methyl-5-hydroxy-6-metoxy-1,4-benzoquinol methylase
MEVVPMDVKEQDILGDRIEEHWYYVAKGNALLQFLEGYAAHEVLDIGAGSGFFSKRLVCAGICERAVCVDTAYTVDRTEIHCGRQIIFLRSIDQVTQDMILMMDVIEHVDDDVGFIRAYTDQMPQGAVLLVTVPAFQFLWSGHDVFLEHKRRYTLTSLHRTIDRAGLDVIRSRYFFSILFPAICALRLGGRLKLASSNIAPRSDLRIHSAWTNGLLTALHELERRSLFRFNRMAGLTAFCLAKRK